MDRSLVIVQNKPTQFDGPLYCEITRRGDFRLSINYTESSATGSDIDPEISRSPEWDHLQRTEYRRRYITGREKHDVKGIAHRIGGENPALVILCGYHPWLHTRLGRALRKSGIRVGLRSDNTLPHSNFGGAKGLAKRLLLPGILRSYDSWHPVGTLAHVYLKKIARTDRPAFPFPYNVDNEWFDRRSTEYRNKRATVKASLGVTDDEFVVLGILKWHEREDPLTLIRAFASVENICPQARLVLLGDGPLRRQVREAVKYLSSEVVLPGYVPYTELPRFYAIADVFVHPAVDEPWGVSVNEAMACGLPIVVAEGVGSHVDLVAEGQNGYVFANTKTEQLAMYLKRLYEGPELIKAMGEKSRSVIHQWSYAETIKQLESAMS